MALSSTKPTAESASTSAPTAPLSTLQTAFVSPALTAETPFRAFAAAPEATPSTETALVIELTSLFARLPTHLQVLLASATTLL